MASTVPGGPAQSHSQGRDPKKVKVKLTIEEVDRESGKVTRFTSKQESGDPFDNGKGDFDFKDKTKWNAAVQIEITVQNQSRCVIAFAKDPLWVSAQSTCPQSASYEPDEFKVLPGGSALELTVLDYNKTSGDYGYTLRFESGDSKTGFFLLDPVISNGGGGGFMV